MCLIQILHRIMHKRTDGGSAEDLLILIRLTHTLDICEAEEPRTGQIGIERTGR